MLFRSTRTRTVQNMARDIEESTSEPFSAEKYFATQPPPPTLEEDVSRVRDFVRRQQEAKRKVVLVTVCFVHGVISSFADVPLERRDDRPARIECVRGTSHVRALTAAYALFQCAVP